jgi:hypothetical protein
MSDTQKPHAPDEKADIPAIPTEPKLPKDVQTDDMRKTVKYRTLTLMKWEGGGIIKRQVPSPDIIYMRPSVKKTQQRAVHASALKKCPSPLRNVSAVPAPSITSIARGRMTTENPAALHDLKVKNETVPRGRLSVIYLRHAAGQPGFRPELGFDAAVNQLCSLKEKYSTLEENESEIFRAVANTVLSLMGHQYQSRLNDDRILSIERMIFDDATPRKISEHLHRISTMPLPPLGKKKGDRH